MYQSLVPCPSCSRHVRATEPTCPFCSGALPGDLESRAIPGAPYRMTRAAVLLFGASLAVTSCGSEVTVGQAAGATSGGQGGAGGKMDGGPDDDGGGQPLYGLPPPPMDAGKDGGNPKDGGPSTDAGMDAPSDDGGPQPIYGSPPPPPKGGG